MDLNMVGWVGTAISMVGTYLNSKGNRTCFYVWLLSGGIFITINVMMEMWSVVALLSYNIVMSINGLRKWSKNAKPS